MIDFARLCGDSKFICTMFPVGFNADFKSNFHMWNALSVVPMFTPLIDQTEYVKTRSISRNFEFKSTSEASNAWEVKVQSIWLTHWMESSFVPTKGSAIIPSLNKAL